MPADSVPGRSVASALVDNRGVAAIPISDADDERLGDYRALTDVELRTRWEPPHGLFIAEGEPGLPSARGAGGAARVVLTAGRRVDQLADLPLDGVPVYAATQDVLELVTGFHVH